MSKATVIVVSYCLITLCLFALMLYLMTTINPPPLFDNMNRIPNVESQRFMIVSATKPNNKSIKSNNKDIKTQTIPEPNNPYLVNVYPPILPPVFITNQEETRVISVTKPIEKNVTLPIKGHRRSVDTQYVNANSVPVVLKILDDFGESRIEIKVDPSFNKRGYRRSLKKASADYIDVVDGLEDIAAVNGTEILIMPNYTVIFNDNITDTFDSDHFVSSIFKDFKVNTSRRLNNDLANFDNVNDTLNDNKSILALKVKIDNETKVITDS